ncbi:gliding motility-associated C-terminal domain-containing protein [Mesonia maritima]|uniref:gliding motility-associated C-terminal domain-containing protein n=1 Tax=Mesonia maritima TaxID=1793873 RepID=UPI003632CF95
MFRIFNTSGYGFYSFSYTVFPNHPICHEETSTIPVIIRRIIDFTGTNLSIDSICEDEIDTHDFVVNFNNLPGIDNVPTYDYQINYTISGPVSFSGAAEITRANPFFNIDDNFTPTVGNYTLTIDSITVDDPEDIVCDIIWDLTTDFEILEIPNLEDASIDIPDICVGENNTVTISNANLTDGDYAITYEISGANSVSNSINLTFQNGSASFDLDNSLLQNTGTTTLTITGISDDFCDNSIDLSTNFEINPLPDPDNYEIIIENSCFGESVLVTINDISNINQIEIIYNISGANGLSDETITLNINNNSVEFTIPATTFTNTGTSTFNLIYVTNVETGCASQATNTKDFTLYPIPDAPQAPTPQEFCEVEEATISDLIPNGNNYLWFENQTSTTELNPTTLLSNQDYYVSIISNDGCISDKTLVSVIINQVPPVNLIQDGASFCGADNPTISDLTKNVSVTNFTVEWYDSNGNLLSEDTPLSDDTIYFGYNIDQANNCEASDAIEVSVTLTNCDTENPDKEYDFFIPDAFSPNNDGINDTFRIKNIQFIYPEYEFDIYNRYGKLLFTGDIKHPEWNGETENSSDKIAPNGVYFYVIRFNKNNKSPKQGRLYLNR